MNNYVHNERYTTIGAREVLRVLFEEIGTPSSLLDVGCGVGTWLAAATELGCRVIHGMDGTEADPAKLVISNDHLEIIDFERDWMIADKFDLIISMEVAEHLTPAAADRLIANICGATDRVLFSAAIPKQPGQHHINCRWPHEWQAVFNRHGFQCSDDIRWKLWSNELVESWYRQNVFFASRAQSDVSEPRLARVIHPDMLDCMARIRKDEIRQEYESVMMEGGKPVSWYLRTAAMGVCRKIKRQFRGT
jgi:SAM-dependent methyltransferase